jgi:WD40 repeat protein
MLVTPKLRDPLQEADAFLLMDPAEICETRTKLDAAINREGRLLGVAYSPDGRRLVTSGMTAPGDVRVWDATTGAELFTMRGLKDWADGVAWSPDGRRIGVGSSDGTVKVFDAGSGLELFALRGHTAEVRGVAFSPDGSLLASGGGDRMVRLWDSTQGQEVRTLSTGSSHRINDLVLSADGKTFGYAVWVPQVGYDVKVRAADTRRDVLTVTGLGGVNKGREMLHQDPVHMAFSPDGARFAVGTGTKVRIWDLATGREVLATEASREVLRIIFSPDGKTVALITRDGPTEDRVTLRGLADGREACSVAASTFGLAFSPDGSLAAFLEPKSRAVSVLEVASGNIVRVMQGRDGKPLSVQRNLSPFLAAGELSFTADGRRLLLCEHSRGDVIVWDAGSGRLLHSHKGLGGKSVQFSAFSPDGSRLVAASPDLRDMTLWDTTTGQRMFTLEGASGRNPAVAPGESRDLVWSIWSTDGSTVAAADRTGVIRFWSAAPRTEEVQRARRAAWKNCALDWHRASARDAEWQRHGFAAAFHLSRQIDVVPAEGSLFLRCGLANAQAERWAEAAKDFGKAIEIDRIETFETRYRHALLQRWKGDLPGYRRAVAFLLERWGNTKDPKVACRLMQASLLDGEKAVDRKSVEQFVQVMLSANDVAVTVAEKFGTRLEHARTYAELRNLLKRVGMNKEQNARLSCLYFPLLCDRLGDDYEAPFWLGRVAVQIPEARHYYVEVIEGRVNVHDRGNVSWENLLELDLLQRATDALLKKAGH